MADRIVPLRTNVINEGGDADDPAVFDRPQVGLDHLPTVRALMGVADPVTLAVDGISPGFVAIGAQANPAAPVNVMAHEWIYSPTQTLSYLRVQQVVSGPAPGAFSYRIAAMNDDALDGVAIVKDDGTNHLAPFMASMLAVGTDDWDAVREVAYMDGGIPVLDADEFRLSATKIIDTNGFYVGGVQVVGERGAHIANPSGGGVQDAEARTAINSILSFLETWGALATS